MKDAGLRDLKDRYFDHMLNTGPFSRWDPNLASFVALVLGIAGSILIICKYYILALVFWILNRIFDALDGSIARKFQKQTIRGGYIDLLFDFIIYVTYILALMYANRESITIVFMGAGLLGLYYLNTMSWMYLSSLEGKGEVKTSIIMPTGLIEGFETIVFYSLFLLFPSYLPLLFGIFGLGIIITIIQRTIYAFNLQA